MPTTVTLQNVPQQTDVNALWDAFLDAKSAGDDELAQALRARMAAIQQQVHLAATNDRQLRAKITNLRTPGEDAAHGEVGDASDLSHLTEASGAMSGELVTLLSEAQRRGIII